MRKRISVEQLTLGMHVQEFCGSWMDHPFWRGKFLLNNPNDLASIRASGIKAVWIDSSKGVDVVPPAGTVTSVDRSIDAEAQATLIPPTVEATPTKEIARVSAAQEMARAAKICAHTKQAVVSMFEEVRMGKSVDVGGARQLVDGLRVLLRHARERTHERLPQSLGAHRLEQVIDRAHFEGLDGELVEGGDEDDQRHRPWALA